MRAWSPMVLVAVFTVTLAGCSATSTPRFDAPAPAPTQSAPTSPEVCASQEEGPSVFYDPARGPVPDHIDLIRRVQFATVLDDGASSSSPGPNGMIIRQISTRMDGKRTVTEFLAVGSGTVVLMAAGDPASGRPPAPISVTVSC